MRLIDLDPVWLTFEGRRVGFIFRCPLPGRREQWQTCFVEKFYMFKSRAGTYSDDDTAFEPDSQCGIVHACAADRIRDPGNSCNWQSCNPEHQWTVEGGIQNASFETIHAYAVRIRESAQTTVVRCSPSQSARMT